jgi:hypothetical protein
MAIQFLLVVLGAPPPFLPPFISKLLLLNPLVSTGNGTLSGPAARQQHYNEFQALFGILGLGL